MKTFFRIIILVTVLAVGSAAHAVTFDYSYQLTNGNTVGDLITGSFTGTANGNLIQNLSNITCSINGTALAGSGSLTNSSYIIGSGSSPSGSQFSPGTAVASFDGTQNNFFFSNGSGSQPALSSTNYFYLIPWTSPTTTDAAQFFSTTQLSTSQSYYPAGTGYQAGYYEWPYNGTYVTKNWSVKAVPTPIPAAAWLLGTGLLGLIGIKRKVNKA